MVRNFAFFFLICYCGKMFIPGASSCAIIECMDDNPNKVRSEGSIMDCGQDKVCNKEKSGTCASPCVPKKVCPIDVIVPNNDSKYCLVAGNLMKCPDGQTCNKDYNATCQMCVEDENSKPEENNNSNSNGIESTNCNSNAESIPCRKSMNRGFYYKCERSFWFFVAKIYSCSDIENDSTCKNKGVCKQQ